MADPDPDTLSPDGTPEEPIPFSYYTLHLTGQKLQVQSDDPNAEPEATIELDLVSFLLNKLTSTSVEDASNDANFPFPELSKFVIIDTGGPASSTAIIAEKIQTEVAAKKQAKKEELEALVTKISELQAALEGGDEGGDNAADENPAPDGDDGNGKVDSGRSIEELQLKKKTLLDSSKLDVVMIVKDFPVELITQPVIGDDGNPNPNVETDPGLDAIVHLYGETMSYKRSNDGELDEEGNQKPPIIDPISGEAEKPTRVMTRPEIAESAQILYDALKSPACEFSKTWGRKLGFRFFTLEKMDSLYLDGGVPKKVKDLDAAPGDSGDGAGNENPVDPGNTENNIDDMIDPFAFCRYFLKWVEKKNEEKTLDNSVMDNKNEIKMIKIEDQSNTLKQTMLYNQRMSNISTQKHDVAVFLSCIVDQCALNIKEEEEGMGKAGGKLNILSREEEGMGKAGVPPPPPSTAETIALEHYLERAFCSAVTEDSAEVERIKDAQVLVDTRQEDALIEPDKQVKVVACLDTGSARHLGHGSLGSVQEVFRRLDFAKQYHQPETISNGKVDFLGLAERSAMRNRIYPFFPKKEFTIVEIERLLLLQAFEELLSAAQPERKEAYSKSLVRRIHHERIPKDLLCHVLHKCISDNEYLINTAYYSRHDAVLLALHYPALAGRTYWHRWLDNSNLTSSSKLAIQIRTIKKECDKLREQIEALELELNPKVEEEENSGDKKGASDAVSAAQNSAALVPPEKRKEIEKNISLLQTRLKYYEETQIPRMVNINSTYSNLDDKTYGNLSILEKTIVPADGSIIVLSNMTRGYEISSPLPGVEIPEVEESVVAGTKESSVSKVLKDGLVLGIRTDGSWLESRKEIDGVVSMAEETLDVKMEEGREEVEDGETPSPLPSNPFREFKSFLNNFEFGSVSCTFSQSQSRLTVAVDHKFLSKFNSDDIKAIKHFVDTQTGENSPQPPPVPDGEEAPEFKPQTILDQPLVNSMMCDQESVADLFRQAGCKLSYVQENGQVVEIHPDGSCYLYWPLMKNNNSTSGGSSSSSSAPGSSSAGGSSSSTYPVSAVLAKSRKDKPYKNEGTIKSSEFGLPSKFAGSDASFFTCGQVPEDVETARRVQPDGTLIRILKTGRVEMFYNEGTVSIRNPTLEELEKIGGISGSDASPSGTGTGSSSSSSSSNKTSSSSSDNDWLSHVKVSYRELSSLMAEALSPEQISNGLPGHWVVTKVDGTRTVRVDKTLLESQFRTGLKNKSTSDDGGDAGDGGANNDDGIQDPDANPDQNPDDPDGQGNSGSKRRGAKSIIDVLTEKYGCQLVDEGTQYEYTLPSIPVARSTDPHTLEVITTSANGLLVIESDNKNHRRCILKDGSIITWKVNDGPGSESVMVEKPDLMPKIIATHDLASLNQNTTMNVYVSDGSIFTVQPKIIVEDDAPEDDDGSGDNNANKKSTVLFPCPPEQRATHCSIVFRHTPSRSVFRSDGLGAVDVFSKGDIEKTGESELLSQVAKEGFYCADLKANTLKIIDIERNTFVVKGNQEVDLKLAVSMGDEDAVVKDPACGQIMKKYTHPDASFLPVPSICPPARLFIIYADGEAEEILDSQAVADSLRDAGENPNAVVVKDEPLSDPLEGCRCSTIYRVEQTHQEPLKYHEAIVLPQIIRGLQSTELLDKKITPIGLSQETYPVQQFTLFRQFVEYPAITDEKKSKFLDLKENYEDWEWKHSAVYRALQKEAAERALKESKKKKKGGGGGGKGKKGKKEEEPPPPPPPPPPPKGPRYSMNVLIERVLKQRNTEQPRFPYNKFCDIMESKRPDIMASKIQAVNRGRVTRRTMTAKKQEMEKTQQELKEKAKEEEEKAAAEKAKSAAENTDENGTKKGLVSAKTQVFTGLEFKYFESQQGLKFLLETGQLDPDSRIEHKQKEKMPDLDMGLKIKSVWKPRLVDEMVNDFVDTEELFENSHAEFPYGTGGDNGNPQDGPNTGHDSSTQGHHNYGGQVPGTHPHPSGSGIHVAGPPMKQGQGHLPGLTGPNVAQMIGSAQNGPNGPRNEDTVDDDYLLPDPPEDRRPSRPTSPMGPHPDKRSSMWDVYGNRRMNGKLISKAYITTNENYLQVEGATDRRTRTVSVIHKKNVMEAPSVSQVRKSGYQVMTGDHLQTLVRSRNTIQPLKDEDQEKGIRWELTSTLQGLGDPNCLVEVVPGHVRFGLLRRGGVYQIVLNLKNLDVEGTRFNILPPKSDFVKINYQPRQVPPGLSLQCLVELWGHHSARIQQVIEIRCKGHIIKIPVSARILEPEEYDSLDAESVLLNNKRILAPCVRLQFDSDLKLKHHYIAPSDFQSYAETKGGVNNIHSNSDNLNESVNSGTDTPQVLKKVKIPKYRDPALDDSDEEKNPIRLAVMGGNKGGGYNKEEDTD